MSEKLVLRKKYEELVSEANKIIEGLDVKDKKGRITDSGFVLVYRVIKRFKDKMDITDQIDIIGHSNWERLNEIWKKIRLIEEYDRKCIKNKKS